MDNKITKFVKDIEMVSPEKAKIVEQVRKMHREYPQVSEKFIYGGIGFFIGKKQIGGVYVYRDHVSVIFSEGFKLSDPERILEGEGKFRRHIKVFELADLEKKKAESFVSQNIELENKIML